jgi:acyl transferase domain-containing protein
VSKHEFGLLRPSIIEMTSDSEKRLSNPELSDEHATSEIAIVGMAGRFPMAPNLEEFWQKLRDGRELITFFTDEELLASSVPPALLNNPNYVKAAAVLEDVELLDGPFFGINPKEAMLMDPQHRIFLESAWQALENAGYDSEQYRGLIGVYAGVSISTYLWYIYANPDLVGAMNSFQILLANDKDHLPTRVSYKLNLKGPSVNIQTACSTSLVSVHLACQGLLNGECDMALAGGVSVRIPQKAGYFYQEGAINSPDGRCRAFDRHAQGTIGGSGVGIVVLKRLADALADGDHIRAIIKGTAVNNDGALKVGYTAPSVDAQAQVIAEAISIAGVSPQTIQYVEAHGTGTALGDPIEITALNKAFRHGNSQRVTEQEKTCAIGSVKTNMGHLDAAAGVAGLIKTVLALEHRMIPPSLHYEQPNPEIDFDRGPFYVNTQLSEWKNGSTPRRAGVSSFGIGGTNAHVVIEEAPRPETERSAKDWRLLVISAKTESALEAATTNLATHLEQHPDAELADVAYTLQVGRRAFQHRRMLVAETLTDAISMLRKQNKGRLISDRQKPRRRAVVFMFPGQGSQYVDMGRGLYSSKAVFRAEVDRCAKLFEDHLQFDLREILFPEAAEIETAKLRLNQTINTQPALFVVEYALAKLWMSFGVNPEAMIGHSIGEYVAACLAGVLSLEDAVALVAARGRLMQQAPAGAMLAVDLDEQEATSLLGETFSLAAVNGPGRCVLSGPQKEIDELEKALAAKGVSTHRLLTSHAFHSQLMEPILPAFVAQVRQVSLNTPRIPFISNVSGSWITPAEAVEADYWAKQLRHTVRFAAGIAELRSDPDRVLLEVGPGHSLTSLARRSFPTTPANDVVNSLQHAQGSQPDEAHLLKSVGQLWLAGVDVDWQRLHAGDKRRRLPLPTYPFERQRYWIDSAASTSPAVNTKQTSPPRTTNQNGNTHAQTAEQDSAIEWIVRQQLEVISAQLDILHSSALPQESGLEKVSTGSGSDLVSDQHAIFK